MEKGDVIIFPTDTVYGIGCKIYDKKGLDKIFDLKKRPIDKKIPILIPDIVSINNIAKYSHRDLRIMQKFWPGALTVILNTTKEFERLTGDKTIALRIPDHYIALNILNKYGPLRTTSANISGEEPTNDFKKIIEQFSNKVFDIVVDKNPSFSNKASTIIDLTENDIKIIRQGDITIKDILEA